MQKLRYQEAMSSGRNASFRRMARSKHERPTSSAVEEMNIYAKDSRSIALVPTKDCLEAEAPVLGDSWIGIPSFGLGKFENVIVSVEVSLPTGILFRYKDRLYKTARLERCSGPSVNFEKVGCYARLWLPANIVFS